MSITRLRASRRLRRTLALGTGTAVLTGGAAFAYWTASGSGTGSATSGNPGTITVNQTSVVSNVNPGTAAQTLSGNFDNAGPGSAYVTSVSVSIASVTKAVGAPAGTCDATDYTIAGSPMSVGASIPQGTAQGSWSGATIAFNNKGTNQDGCKGATINFAYTSN